MQIITVFLLAQKRAARSLKKFDPDWVSTISTATAHVVAEELMLPRSEYIENYALRKSDGRLVDALHGFVKPALVFNYQDPETGLVTRHSAFDVFMANELLFPAISRLKPVHIRKSNFVMNYPSSVVTVSPVKHVLDGLINGKYVDVSSRDPSSGKDIYEIACDKLDHKLIRDLVNYYDFDPRAKNPQTGLSGLNALAQALAGATPSEVLDYQRCVRELFVVGVRESEVAALARRYIKEEAENMAKLEGNFSKQTASLEMS